MKQSSFARGDTHLPGTTLLTTQTDFAEQMVAGIDRALRDEVAAAPTRRTRKWKRDFSSHEAYEKSSAQSRRRLQRMTGLVDDRLKPDVRAISDAAKTGASAATGGGQGYDIFDICWPVLKGVDGEGLLLEPQGPARANVVALPDCDWTPEMLAGLAAGVPPRAQFARRLAENGCRVVIPALIDRRDTHSGYPWLVLTNQPHREFIYRAAFQVGRHIIGYEVQKILSVVDWFDSGSGGRRLRVGVIGYGEGGLLALHAAAADTRVDAAAVCGYFGPREQIWQEPIYRNLFGVLEEFGDAELAALVAPRTLVVEACRHPQVDGPPPRGPRRIGGAAGRLRTPPPAAVAAEFERARELISQLAPAPHLELVGRGNGPPGSDMLLGQFLRGLKMKRKLLPSGRRPKRSGAAIDGLARLRRQFEQLVNTHATPARRIRLPAQGVLDPREQGAQGGGVEESHVPRRLPPRHRAKRHPSNR